MGIKLLELLKARESRHPSGPQGQPLSQRDFVIHHIGSGLDSSYDPDAVEDGLYEIDFTGIEPYQITPILEALAEKARMFYFGEYEGPTGSPPVLGGGQTKPAPVTVTQTTLPATPGRIQPHAKEPVKAAPVEAGTNRIQPKAKQVVDKDLDKESGLDEFKGEGTVWGQHPSVEQIESADSPAIRKWLDENKVEYPARANRAMLIKLATASAEPPPY
jgi:hypothetical protein